MAPAAAQGSNKTLPFHPTLKRPSMSVEDSSFIAIPVARNLLLLLFLIFCCCFLLSRVASSTPSPQPGGPDLKLSTVVNQ